MKTETENRNRTLVFVIVAALHIAAVFLIAFNVHIISEEKEPGVEVMKLVDVKEAPPPPVQPVQQNVNEALAENLMETDVVPALVTSAQVSAAPESEEYLSQGKVSKTPKFNDREILSRLVYPPMALRSGILEGRVVLELFINKQGLVTRVIILKEEPEGRGFGEAAALALEGARAAPAEANGIAVGVRYRYPVRFQLR